MTPEQLKASILQRAMEGKLVPQDPNDEPASELLKRIKAEKEKLIKEGKIKRDKNETEIFRGDDGLHYEKFQDGSVRQIEVPYEIPESWEWIRLENITKIINDGVHSTPKYVNSGIPFLSVKDMSSGRLSFRNTKFISEEEHLKLSKRCKPEKNDIILSKVGTTGIPVKVDVEKEFSIFVSLALLKFIHPFNPDFLVELIKSPLVYNQSKDGTRGVGNKNLVLSVIKKFLIPLPPVNEQTRILNRINQINKFVVLFEKFYSSNKKIKEEFPEKLRQSILQYAMQGKLVSQDSTDEPVEVLLERIREEKQRLFEEGKLKKKDLHESIICQGDDGLHYEKFQDGTIKQVDVPFEIPESWKWVKLNNILDVRDGTHTTPKYVKDGVPLLTSKNLINGKLVKEPSKLISLAESNEINKRSRVEENDILLAMIGTIGNPVLVPKIDYQFSVKNVAILKYISTINMEFVYYFIVYFSTKLKSMSSGAVQNFVSLNQLRNILFPVPPTTEQNRIIDKIKKMLILIDRYSYLHNSLEEKN